VQDHPEFLARIVSTRAMLAQGRGVPMATLDNTTEA
jgi:hypothetical protein